MAHIELTNQRGVPGMRFNGPRGRQWYQGLRGLRDAPAFIQPWDAPADSGMLIAPRDEMMAEDPVGQAQATMTQILDQAPTSELGYLLRPAVGGAAAMASGLPTWLRLGAAVWGLWPLWRVMGR